MKPIWLDKKTYDWCLKNFIWDSKRPCVKIIWKPKSTLFETQKLPVFQDNLRPIKAYFLCLFDTIKIPHIEANLTVYDWVYKDLIWDYKNTCDWCLFETPKVCTKKYILEFIKPYLRHHKSQLIWLPKKTYDWVYKDLIWGSKKTCD